MTKAPIKRKKGRPPRHPSDVFKTKVWFRGVHLQTGMTAYALEKYFDHKTFSKSHSGGVVRPRKWDRYKNGKMIPKDDESSSSLITKVDKEIPGTAYWFRHIIWEVLKKEKSDTDGVNFALKLLDPAIQKLLFENKDNSEKIRPERRPFDEIVVQKIISLGTIDALTASILLAQEAECISSAEMRSLALKIYYGVQPSIAKTPEMELIYPELFSYIDQVYAQWLFVHTNIRARAVIRWQGFRNECWGDK